MSNGNIKGKGIEPGCTAMIVKCAGISAKNNGKTVKVICRVKPGDIISINGDHIIVGRRRTDDDYPWLVQNTKEGMTVKILAPFTWDAKALITMDAVPVNERNLIRLDDPSELTEDDIIETANNLRKQTEQKILSDAINNMLNGN